MGTSYAASSETDPAVARRQQLRERYPDITLLELQNLPALNTYLYQNGWCSPRETLIHAAPAGDGNMNRTLRVALKDAALLRQRTLILKQSYPWVEKYPHIAAPWERLLQETTFYQMVAQTPSVANRMPILIGVDPLSRIAAFEDLGSASDFRHLYRGATITASDLDTLAKWLTSLHHLCFDRAKAKVLSNRPMRRLNHEHIFDFPFRCDNGLDLDAITPGLQALAHPIQQDRPLNQALLALGERYYLTDGPTLLHGDFFPGSWLNTHNGVHIIDTEFAFFGQAAFDAGVALAHLLLSRQPQKRIEQFLNTYTPPDTTSPLLLLRLAGAEILRRLLGVAQLPLALDLAQKHTFLATARQFVLAPDLSLLRNCYTACE